MIVAASEVSDASASARTFEGPHPKRPSLGLRESGMMIFLALSGAVESDMRERLEVVQGLRRTLCQ